MRHIQAADNDKNNETDYYDNITDNDDITKPYWNDKTCDIRTCYNYGANKALHSPLTVKSGFHIYHIIFNRDWTNYRLHK